MKHFKILAIVCLFFIGCTQVELCDVGVHPHLHELQVNYNWPADLAKEERPDSMYILANRLFNTIRYQFSYNLLTEEGRLVNFWSHETAQGASPLSRNGEGEGEGTGEGTGEGEGNKGTGEGNTEGNEGGTEEGGEEEPAPEQPVFTDFSIRNGQYQMLTFNHTDKIIVDSLDTYMTSNTVKSASLGISYYLYDYPQFRGKPYKQWTDFNKGYPYAENIGPLFLAQKTVETEERDVINITFDPESLTQEITFNFGIQLSGRNVVVDSVRAEISGVSRSVKLFSRYIDMDATKACRMIFDVTPAPMTTDSLVNCSGKVHVPGLMNSEDETMKTGPGLLYIAAYVHVTDDEGTVIKKTCYAGINLRSHILEQPLTLLTEDGYHHTISKPKAVINIENLLPISAGEISGIAEPEGNIEYWFKEEGKKGDYDLEV